MNIREWLEEKRSRGVKQVYVTSVLERLPSANGNGSLHGLDSLLFGGEKKADLTAGSIGLMGTWEVAKYLGVEKSRIARWLFELDQGKSPIAPPVARLKSGSFWLATDVDAKLRSMYAEARSPYGKTEAGLRRWARERRERRVRV